MCHTSANECDFDVSRTKLEGSTIGASRGENLRNLQEQEEDETEKDSAAMLS